MPAPVLIDIPDTLRSTRLDLRPPRPGDGAALYEAMAESLPEMRRFLGSLPWVAADQSVEASEVFCRTAQANFLARLDLPFFMFERGSGRLVGCVGLHRPVWATPKFEVGYWCRTSQVGQGLVTEGVGALAALAFGDLGAVRLELITDEQNAPSRRVADRCDFTLEAVLKNERRAPDGSLRNTCIYARTSDVAPSPEQRPVVR